ncbi:type IV pilin protein [Thaumasiovibrio subtropicus]|nr:type IV pilin protein [Thaumasiovibrio subtropicus]
MKQKGVTLIELMIVVAVIGVLSAIVYPSYKGHVQKSHRAQAKTNLTMMQFWAEEKVRAKSLTDTTITSTECPSCNIDTNRYTYSIVSHATFTYVITASIAAGGPQVGDDCGNLILKGNGATDADESNCW